MGANMQQVCALGRELVKAHILGGCWSIDGRYLMLSFISHPQLDTLCVFAFGSFVVLICFASFIHS